MTTPDNPWEGQQGSSVDEADPPQVVTIPAPVMQVQIQDRQNKPLEQALRQLQMTLTGLQNVMTLVSQPVVNVAAPKVPTPQIDLSGLTEVIENLGTERVSAQDIADAVSKSVASALKAMPARKDATDKLDKPLERLAKSLDQVEFRLRAPTHGGGGGGPSITPAVDAINTLRTSLLPPGSAVGLSVTNANLVFRSGFAAAGTQPDPGDWVLSNDTAGTASTDHLVSQGGNSSGSSYLRISLSPFVDGSEVNLTSVATLAPPTAARLGLSMSQRVVGQEVLLGLVGVDSTGTAQTVATPADVAITGATITIAANVGTVTITNHGFNGGDRVDIYGCAEPRLNVGPVVVTPVDANNFTVPIVLANGTYSTTGGYVRYADPFALSAPTTGASGTAAYNGGGLLFENTTTTNASMVARRNGAKFRSLNSTVGSTTASQTNVAPYTDAFNAAANNELLLTSTEFGYRAFTSDGVSGNSGQNKYTQGLPDESLSYKVRIRARNLKGMTMPVARITAIAKTGTTTATVTTDVAHGLTINSQVQIYGVQDQANFPNLTAQTAVASVIDANNFTVVIGSATTTSSSGGVVWSVQGSTLAPGVFSQVVQSVSRTNGIMTLIGNATWATPLPGEFVQVWGMQNGAGQYDGAYKVLRVSTTTLDLAAPGADFTSINTGGALIRRTDVRLHFVQAMDYNPVFLEGQRGSISDINNSLPVSITGSAAISVTASQTTGVNTTQWSAAGWGGFLVADVASAALTTTTTTTAVTPGSVANLGTYAHSFNVVVTAVSGTTPTLDVGVEESIDNGTNWVRIYDFERITATGAYTSPLIPAQYGTRYRYVQTVAGTTPSFTRAVNRDQISVSAPYFRRFIDRSIVLTTLNSVTPTYNVERAETFSLIFNVGAITTTAPQLQLEGSEDNANWYAIGAPLTAVASSTVQQYAPNTAAPKFVRGRISTAGVGVTAGYISIKAIGR